jgi:hypothetical protein
MLNTPPLGAGMVYLKIQSTEPSRFSDNFFFLLPIWGWLSPSPSEAAVDVPYSKYYPEQEVSYDKGYPI